MCDNCGCRLHEDTEGQGQLCPICDPNETAEARQEREDAELRLRLALWVRG